MKPGSVRTGLGSYGACAVLLVVAAVLLAPLLYGVSEALSTAPRRPPTKPPLGAPEALRFARSVLIAGGIAGLATAFAMPVALALRGARGRTASLAALAFAPLLLPSYLAYAAWGTLRAPGTALGSWVAGLIAHNGATYGPIAAHTQAVLGLALWSWPIAMTPMLLRLRALPAGTLDASALFERSRVRRTLTTLRAIQGSILAGFGLTLLVMLGSAVPLHLANMETYAIAVWRSLELTGGARTAWITALPLLGLAGVAGSALALCASRAPESVAPRAAPDGDPPARLTRRLAWGVLGASTLAPAAALAFALREARSLAVFWRDAGPDLARSLALAGVVGALASALTLVACVAFAPRAGRGPARGAYGALGVFLAMALTPGVLLASALLRASNTDATAFLADTPIGLVAAHLARFGAVALLAGWFLARCEPPALRDARLLSDPSLRGWARATLPAHLPGVLAAGLAVGALSLHEIEAAALLSPPGLETFPRRMLSMLHYLRMEELIAAMLWTLALGMVVASGFALVAAVGARTIARAARVVAPIAALALLLPGCERPAPDGEPLRVLVQFGETGDKPGQLAYPRAIDADTVHNPPSVWIADRTGRIQRYGLDGAPLGLFTIPQWDAGMPVGLTMDDQGRLWVADTHYHRVLVYTPDGAPGAPGAPGTTGSARLTAQFGAYGKGDGQFIYPTDVALVPSPTGDAKDSRIFVSEYGGNDRVSCFDGEFTFLFSFGREGSGSGQNGERVEFQRPQSLVWDPARQRLFVADSGNHRIGVFTIRGELERWIGATAGPLGPVPGDPDVRTPGAAAFNFPYGLAPLDPRGGGDLLVVEYAACRVQRIDPDTATTLRVHGRPGRGPGELVQPWGVAVADGIAYLLDSRNNRVVSFRP